MSRVRGGQGASVPASRIPQTRRFARVAALAVGATGVLAACTVAGPRPGERLPPGVPDDMPVERPAGAPRAEPEVRVGVKVDVPSVEVAAEDRVELVDESGRSRAVGPGPWTVRAVSGDVELSAGGEALRVDGSVVVRPLRGQLRVDGTAYPGAILLRPAASGVTAVNLVQLETYLRGVVPHEIGPGRPLEELEAVKAQAIAARTYAIRHLGRREALGFDFYATVEDQVYGGADAEDPISSRAVRETAGQVLLYGDTPIEAFYHSTCGGRTAALEEVWPGEPRPYLQSVSDQRPGGGWYCESSNRFRWTESWNADSLRDALTRGLESRGRSGVVTEVEAIDVVARSESGRASELRIRTNLGQDVVRGDSIRRVLRPEPNRLLNSTMIEVETHGRDGVERLDVHGAGWGHGIGMCQIGAVGRARAGHSYREILLTYYPGTRIARLY